MTTDIGADSAGTIPPQRSRPAHELLSIPEVITELGVPRSTFYRWRQTGVGPKAIKLPNGQVRVRRAVLEEWLQGLESSTP